MSISVICTLAIPILFYLGFGLLSEIIINKFFSQMFLVLALSTGLFELGQITAIVLQMGNFMKIVFISFALPTSLWIFIMTKPLFHNIRLALKINN